MLGTSEDEEIYGTEGSNILDGEGGDDIILAGLGDDTYMYNKGYGHQVFEDDGGFDEICTERREWAVAEAMPKYGDGHHPHCV